MNTKVALQDNDKKCWWKQADNGLNTFTRKDVSRRIFIDLDNQILSLLSIWIIKHVREVSETLHLAFGSPQILTTFHLNVYWQVEADANSSVSEMAQMER